MMTREEARKITARALEFSTFPECQVQLSETETLNLRFANNGITTSGLTLERSLVVRSTRDARTGVSSADQTDDGAIRAAVRRSEELAALAPPNAEHVAPLGPQEYPALDHFDEETAASRSPALLPHVRAILDRAVKDKLVAAGFFIRNAGAQSVANKADLFAFGRTTDARLSTTFRAPDGSSSGWAGQPAKRLKDIDGSALADRAAEKCLRWKKPVRLDPGKYTVVLEPTATSDLVRMVNSALSARAAEEGRSYFSRKESTALGQKLFPEFITLRSDPADPRLPALPWTGELLPARAVTWIDQGVLKNLAYDRFWASKTGKQPVMPGGAMILDGADATVEDLIKTVDRGLLVTRFWYIRSVNPRTVQLTGLTRDGLFLIEKGEIAGAAMNFRFNESPMRLLENARKLGRVARVAGGEGGAMIAPALVAAGFTFTSISDAV
jgi:predicted Zn-dependent protease